MLNRRRLLILAQAVLIATLLTAATSRLDDPDYRVSDSLYQRQGASSSDVVVIGIDSNTLGKLGTLSLWARRDIAKAVERLNENPATRPAVIGIDLLFTGENSAAPEVDKNLAEVAARYGNVVVASAAIVDEAEFDAAENPHDVWKKTWDWDAPFPALAKAADTGHICEPYDSDGIVRRQLLYINVTERGRLDSFARVIYEKFCNVKGIAPNAPPAVDENGMYYLPFTAKSFDTASFVDLLDGKIDSEFYSGKIVLIGSLAPGMGDEFSTALDRSDSMYGINIHANAIEAFRQNFFPHEVETPLQLAILFVVSFVTAIFFRNGKMQYVSAAWAVICLGWLGACKIFYLNAAILHPLWVPSAVSLIFVGSVANNYIRARSERDKITATFGRYLCANCLTATATLWTWAARCEISPSCSLTFAVSQL